MANITAFIAIIQQAARGEDVRDAIADALEAMNDDIPDSVEAALADAKASGEFDGPQGPTGPAGDDGVSPAVTITTITRGHRVTITDAEHPSGQSFDVMDGAGDMLASVYDPNDTVADAGGIEAYVAAAIGTVIGGQY